MKLSEWSTVEKFLVDPGVVVLEAWFLVLTITNVFIMYHLLNYVIPYPIFVTWWQLSQGLFMAWCLGELGQRFPKVQYFPRVYISLEYLKLLAVPTIFYVAMQCLSSSLLANISCVAIYPILACFTVVLHHLTRFIGCAEEYMKLRWVSIGLLFFSFVVGATDTNVVTPLVIFLSVMCAFVSSVYRGCYLQKIIHAVNGQGNLLHNNQHFAAFILLPLLVICFGEWNVFGSCLPLNFSDLYTWQKWGCLITVGTIPFLKNIVSNRLVKRTGQAPWRMIEVVSIVVIFIFGTCSGRVQPGYQSWLAFLIAVSGRLVGMYDILKNASNVAEAYGNMKEAPGAKTLLAD